MFSRKLQISRPEFPELLVCSLSGLSLNAWRISWLDKHDNHHVSSPLHLLWLGQKHRSRHWSKASVKSNGPTPTSTLSLHVTQSFVYRWSLFTRCKKNIYANQCGMVSDSIMQTSILINKSLADKQNKYLFINRYPICTNQFIISLVNMISHYDLHIAFTHWFTVPYFYCFLFY